MRGILKKKKRGKENYTSYVTLRSWSSKAFIPCTLNLKKMTENNIKMQYVNGNLNIDCHSPMKNTKRFWDSGLYSKQKVSLSFFSMHWTWRISLTNLNSKYILVNHLINFKKQLQLLFFFVKTCLVDHTSTNGN